MSERYYITGVQLGLIKMAIQSLRTKGTPYEILWKEINKIEENQFIGRIEEGQKVVIRE